MRSIILRNRASAVLGLLVIALVLFDGLPDSWTNILYLILGLLIAILGFTGNHYANKLYEEGYGEEARKKVAEPEFLAQEDQVESLEDDNRV